MPLTHQTPKVSNVRSVRQSAPSANNRNQHSLRSARRQKPTPQSAKLYDKLSGALRQALENICVNEQTNASNESSRIGIDFGGFYNLMDAVLKDQFLQWPAIVEIYRNVVVDLLKIERNKLSELQPPGALIEQLEMLLHKMCATLDWKYVRVPLAYVEQMISLHSVAHESMLFHEIMCHLFLAKVIHQPQIMTQLHNLRFAYFNMARDKLKKRLLAQEQASGSNENQAREAEMLADTNRLLALFTRLDEQHVSVRTQLFEMPLIQESQAYGKRIVDELVDRLEPLDYIRFVEAFLAVNRTLLLSLEPISSQLVSVYVASLAHFMLTNAWSRIIANNRLNLARLLNHNHVNLVAEIFKIVSRTAETIEEKRLFEMLLELVDEYLDQLRHEMRSDFRFETRINMLEFAAKVFELKHRFDSYLATIFQLNCHVSTKFGTFFVQMFEQNPRCLQALAYAIFDLLYPESSLLFSKLAPIVFADKYCPDFPLADPQSRLELAKSFYSLMVYLKDHNDFIDYVKHYFCCSLLYGPKNMSVAAIHANDRLEYFDRLMAQINQVVTLKSLAENAPYGYFVENLNVFQLLEKDFRQSDKAYDSVRSKLRKLNKTWKLPKAEVYSLKKANILHGLLWKTTDFDQCLLPSSMAVSWSAFVQAFNDNQRDQNAAQKRLALNTKHSVVTMETKYAKVCNLQLTLTAHQAALLECFNCFDRLKYKQIAEATKFKHETNLQLALLSLVVANLLSFHHQKTTLAVDDNKACNELVFTFNDDFYKDYIANPSQRPIQEVNLTRLEMIDFWILDLTNLIENYFVTFNGQSYFKHCISNKKIHERVKDLLSCFNLAKDASLQLSTLAVESREAMHQTINNLSKATSAESISLVSAVECIALQPNVANLGQAVGTPPTAKGTQRSTSSKRRKTRKRKRKMFANLTPGQEWMGAGASTPLERAVPVVANPNESVIGLDHKLECALVRLLKRERYLPSVNVIHRKLIKSIDNNPKAGFTRAQLETISVTEVRRILDALVSRAFLSQHLNGGYNYVL